MTLTSRERAELRAEAHRLSPLVHVGHQGLTDALLQTIDDALRTHELVKVALAKTTDEAEGRVARHGGETRGRRRADDRADLHALSGKSGPAEEEGRRTALEIAG